jgi:hypothetical protein
MKLTTMTQVTVDGVMQGNVHAWDAHPRRAEVEPRLELATGPADAHPRSHDPADHR